MMRERFKAWLMANPKNYRPTTISDYLAECAWVEKHCGVNLDQYYEQGRIASLLSRLTPGVGKDLCLLIKGNPDTNLSSYRSAVRRYVEFRRDTVRPIIPDLQVQVWQAATKPR
jgi:hypothetical protein